MALAGVSPLVGRDGEVAALVAAAEEARAGRPCCVLVTGEAGIGKTRLVEEAVARLDGALVLTGRAVDMATGEIPFGVLADTIRDLCEKCGEEALLPADRATLGPLLPGETSPASAAASGILGGALDLLARLSADRLLVWVVEDFHWADAATRDLVHLAVRTGRGRLLVVVTVRTGDAARPASEDAELAEQVAALSRVPGTRRVEVPALVEDQVLGLLGSLAEGLEPEARLAIARLSDGVPFVVEELAAARGRPEHTTVSGALGSRVAGLGPSARRLVAAAAVGDGHLRISLLERVVDLGDGFDPALGEAVELGVLVCDYTTDRVGFRHALLRQAVDATIGPVARREWHRRWAEVLQTSPGLLARDLTAVAVAEHWHLAGDAARSVVAAHDAVPAAQRTGGDTLRLELWRRIIEGWDNRDPCTGVGQLTWRQALGEALHGTFVHNPVEPRILDAVERRPLRAEEQALVDLARSLLGMAKTGPHSPPVVVNVAREVAWLDQPEDELTLSALVMLGFHLPVDHSGLADRYLARAETLAREAGDHTRLLRVFHARARRLNDARAVSEAIEELQRARRLLEPGDTSERLAIAGDLAWHFLVLGRHADAEAVLVEQLENTPHLEIVPGLWEHLVENATLTWLCTGQWAKARRLVERAAPWWPDDHRLSNLWLARLDLHQHGSTDEERWRDHLGTTIPDGPTDVDLRLVLALAAGTRGDLRSMREMIAPVWAAAVPDDELNLVRAVVDTARIEADTAVEQPTGPDGAGDANLTELTDRCAALPRVGPHQDTAATDLAAQLDRFHGRDARESLQAALAAWTELDHLPDVAVTHLSLAEAHAQAGDRDTARDHLAEGRRIATKLSAQPWLRRAAAITRRYGLTTRDRRPEDVLTGRETEVLALLAEGRTNHEIAQTLVISPKTASVHVSRILTKTGATNRTEAVAIARRHGLLHRLGE